MCTFAVACFVALSAVSDANTIHHHVRLTNAENELPVPGVRVQLDDRVAFSDTAGWARFDWLAVPGQRLVVDHPDFERIDRGAESGGSIAIELVPVRPGDAVIRCVLDGSNEPVPGARVRLTRADDRFAVLPLDGWADFDGMLPFNGLPQGRYRIAVDAAGCLPLDDEIVLDGGTVERLLVLQPERSSIRIEGMTEAGASIEAIRAALPLAAATDPDGQRPRPPVLSRAVADASGRFSIEVPSGLRGANTAPHRVVLRAAKEGFLETFVPVEYADVRGPIRVSLSPAPGISREVEPNDVPQTATPAPRRGRLAFRIDPVGDRDCFSIHLPEDGLLTVNIHSVPIGITTRIVDQRGEERGLQSTGAGRDLRHLYPLTAGTWSLSFERWGNSQTSPDFMEARLEFEPAVDPQERNHQPALAATIEPGQDYYGAIFPSGDRDCYRVRLGAAGLLQIVIPETPLAMTCRVLNGLGEELARQDVGDGRPLALLARIPGPGAYTIEVSHWGDRQYSVTPYRIRADFARADCRDQATHLPLDTVVSGSINPIGDRDRWRVDIRQSGTLRVRIAQHLLPRTVRLLGADGVQLARADAGGGRLLELFVSLQRPGLYDVEVSHWGNREDSPQPYTLSNAFFPNDPWDLRRNDSLHTASRISLVRPVTGAIATVGDQDVYRFHVPWRSVVTADLAPYSLQTTMKLIGPAGEDLRRTDAGAGRANQLVHSILEPGPHWLNVKNWGNRAWTADRYRLNVRLDPEDPWESNDRIERATRLPISRSLDATILPATDVDWYRVDLPAVGRFRVSMPPVPLALSVHVFDARGDQVAGASVSRGYPVDLQWENPAPRTCWVRVQYWGFHGWSSDPYSISVTPEGQPLPPRATLTAQAAENPRTVLFTIAAEGDVAQFQLDVNGDGRFDYQSATAGEIRHQYPRGGMFPAILQAAGPNGSSVSFVWVDSRDLAEQPDVEVEFIRPAPGAFLTEDVVVEFDARGHDGGEVAGAELFLDGVPLRRWNAPPPYPFPLAVERIAGKSAELRVVAWSGRGQRAESAIEVSAPPLVNLHPASGTQVTSGSAVIQWVTAEPGPSEVVVVGPDFPEKVFAGDPGRVHSVLVTDLPAGAEYTWRARTGELESEPRTLHCIRGLEFTQRQFSTAVERDYDQQGIARVVNHGDAAAELVMHTRSEQDDLLVGFVGEGTPEKRVTLEPGEYRDVLLGISAQNAMQERYSFFVTLEGSFGGQVHTDSVEFDVAVRMPNIDYDVTVSDPDPGTLMRRIEIINRGEVITDFRAELDEASGRRAALVPSASHVRLERGERLVLSVVPSLSLDWTDFDATLTLRAIHVKKALPLAFNLPPGKQIFLATVGSRQDNTAADWLCTNRPNVTTVLTVPEGPQIGAPVVSVGASPVVGEPADPLGERDALDRVHDDNFWLDDLAAELKKIRHPDPRQEAWLRAELASIFINKRLRTFNRMIWGPIPSLSAITYHVPGLDLTDHRAAVDLLRGPGSSMGFGIDHANRSWSLRTGACSEHSALMYHVLKAAGTERLTIMESRAGHNFVVVNGAEGADPDRPWTWGPDAFVADSWLQRNLSPQEAWREPWIFRDGQAAVYAVGGGLRDPGQGTSRALYQHALKNGQQWIDSNLEQLRRRLPADFFNEDGTLRMENAASPPEGWLQEGP